jgi:hypothetical protein
VSAVRLRNPSAMAASPIARGSPRTSSRQRPLTSGSALEGERKSAVMCAKIQAVT